MGSEKEGFREQLARIDKAFPDKELLSAQEVANWLGLKRETVIKYYGYAFQAVSSADTAPRLIWQARFPSNWKLKIERGKRGIMMSPLMMAYMEKNRKRERRARRLSEVIESAILGCALMGAVALLICIGCVLEAVI